MPLNTRRLFVACTLIVAFLAQTLPAGSQVSREELDDARERRDEANARLDDAIAEYDAVYAELSTVTFRLGEFEDRIRGYEAEIGDLHDLVEAQAIAAYKSGNTGDVGVLFGVDSLTELLTGREFLERAAEREISIMDRLRAVRNGLSTTKERLEEDRDRLSELEIEQAGLIDEFESLFQSLETDYAELRVEFEEQERRRREEERRRRLAAIAALEGAAAGASASQTEGFVCFFDPPYRFVNDWGNPRSGGRTHKGTDVVASYDHPVKAVATGTVLIRNSDLGGLSLWLDADNGTSYYYAHLSGYAGGLSDGDRVGVGQVIAYNGDSGNARGGVPHVHFQIHPGGRGNEPVNPYPTLVEHCA